LADEPVDTLEQTLHDRFGLEAFRPWQRDAIDALLEGTRRVLVVAPTGGGKSLCYQLPAATLSGTSVVVSPLIALMDDQVRGLAERGIEATFLASTLDRAELHRREERLMEGHYKLVYVAPERLRSRGMMSLLRRLQPPLVAIDEAHCISQWGHDFRPDYLRLGELLESLAPERILACTATATPLVRDEILQRLGFEAERSTVVLRGFARPNLHLEVAEIDGMGARRTLAGRKIAAAIGEPSAPRGAAIVYAGTRKNSDRYAAELAEQGWHCRAYHAGLDPSEREKVSELFATRKLDVVVATNAFGMGIDRPDIRCVVHLQAPGSIEQYYQEVGRGGRDGQPAHGVLISGSADFGYWRRMIESPRDMAATSGARMEQEWKMFMDLMRYVEAGSCRHDFILRYFGDDAETLGGCGHCDVCERLDELGEGGLEGDISPEDKELVVRKALSGVARLRGRAGLTALAASLHGRDTQRLRDLGLTSLSTHGLLSEHALPWIMALLRRLLTAGLVDVTTGDFPVPYLTQIGGETMKAERAVRLILPQPDVGRTPRKKARKRGRSSATTVELSGADATLFEQLRSARLEVAKAKGVPAYVVCHDRTLAEMASLKPSSLIEMADVHGMGPARIDEYGSRFLSVIRDHG
jgi:ATP-dependent DNA helicase RecQ